MIKKLNQICNDLVLWYNTEPTAPNTIGFAVAILFVIAVVAMSTVFG